MGYSEIAKELSHTGEKVSRIVKVLSDEYSRLHCDEEKAIEYAVEKCEGRCLYCGIELYETKSGEVIPKYGLHLDHIYPVSYGGLFTEGNVALACEGCNISKSNKDPIRFYKERISIGRECRFEDIHEFEEMLCEYMKPYKEQYSEHYALQAKLTEDNVVSFETLSRVFIDHLEDFPVPDPYERKTPPAPKPKKLRRPITTSHGLTYDSKFNLTSLSNLSAKNHAILMSILFLVQQYGEVNDNGYLSAEIRRSEISKLSMRRIDRDRAIVSIDKLRELQVSYYGHNEENQFIEEIDSIFESITYDDRVWTITVELNPRMKSILEYSGPRVTTLNISESNALSYIYSKELHRRLSQHKSKGVFKMTVSEWRYHFNVDGRYSDNDIKLNQVIPAIERVAPIFKKIDSNVFNFGIGLPKMMVFEFEI